MFTQQDMLLFLTNILFDLAEDTGAQCDRNTAHQFVHEFYAHLKVPTGDSFNKVSWIKKLRETITIPGTKIRLKYEPGISLTNVLSNHRVRIQFEGTGDRFVSTGTRNLPLKEAKDFIDLMMDFVEQVND
jgi:hypothetical protein